MTIAPLLTVPHPVTGAPLPAILTAAQAAELLRMTPVAVAQACEAGDIPALSHRAGAPWRIPTGRLLVTLGIEAST